MAEKRQAGQSVKQEDFAELKSIAEELRADMKRLLFTLTHEQADEKKKLEIIETLRETALFTNEVKDALKELVARGSECENEEEQTGCLFLDMVGLKAHTELIRRKADSLARQDQEYKDMILDGLLIITGVGLVFIPVGGPALSTALFTLRFATMGKLTGGSIVTGIGLYRVGREIIGGEDEDLKNVFEFVKGAVATSILTKAIFHFAQLGDKDLLEQIVLSSSEEDLIELFYSVIEDGSRSDETRSVAVEALLAFPEELQIRRTRTIQLLMGMADKDSRDLDLGVRISVVKVLGKIGERVPEVAEYLVEKGKEKPKERDFLVETDEEKIEDELRMIVLVQSGRNKAYFDKAIEALLQLITDRRDEGHKSFPNNLEIQLEIPKAFLSAFLSAKVEKTREMGIDVKDAKAIKSAESAIMKQLENHITVLKEFISSEIIDIETKLKFSEILINWTENSSENLEIKAFLRAIWTNPAEDIGLYVNQLSQERPTEENKPAFEFLQKEIEKLKKKIAKSSTIPQEIVFEKIKSMVEEFDKAYSNQKEITEKLTIFTEDYQRTQEIITN